MKELLLIRGLPGSGKSTIARFFSKHVIEADQYHMKNGEYCYDPSKAPDAHKWCQDKVLVSMQCDYQRIVVANTFVEDYMLEPYFTLAERYDYRVHVMIAENRHGSKDIHGVPEQVIRNMENDFSIKLR